MDVRMGTNCKTPQSGVVTGAHINHVVSNNSASIDSDESFCLISLAERDGRRSIRLRGRASPLGYPLHRRSPALETRKHAFEHHTTAMPDLSVGTKSLELGKLRLDDAYRNSDSTMHSVYALRHPALPRRWHRITTCAQLFRRVVCVVSCSTRADALRQCP